MSVLIFPAPVGAAEHWGPAVGVVGMLVVLSGGCGVQFLLLWGPIPSAVSTVPAASGPGVTAGNHPVQHGSPQHQPWSHCDVYKLRLLQVFIKFP